MMDRYPHHLCPEELHQPRSGDSAGRMSVPSSSEPNFFGPPGEPYGLAPESTPLHSWTASGYSDIAKDIDGRERRKVETEDRNYREVLRDCLFILVVVALVFAIILTLAKHAYFGAFAAPQEAPHSRRPPPKDGPLRLIVDVDTGVDDAMALVFAFTSERATVDAVTVVAGNAELDAAYNNTLRVLQVLETTDDVYNEVTAEDTKLAQFLRDINNHSVHCCLKNNPGFLLGDFLAVLAALVPDSVEDSNEGRVDVELGGEYTQGQMVHARLPRMLPHIRHNVTVVRSFNKDMVAEYFRKVFETDDE
ncbi:hypothetical protein V5799_009727 [Amblyomma americanum]|uniref:Inosine/uridine-preferring nucleoside hydrolase domain-containing protein n=1 Tax=Amblyomma americanum TaxID=6943 RepID=A0AAQ4F9J6_AMBAM